MSVISNDNDRIIALDGLRAMAALLVFVTHLSMLGVDVWKGIFGELYWIYDLGHVSVDLFFELSAFLLTLHLLKRPIPYKDYLMRRVMRIVPAYYVSVIFVFGAAAMLGIAPMGDWLLEFVKHMFFLGGVTQQSGLGANVVYWSLSVEAGIYLSLPFLVRFFFSNPVRAMIVAYLASAVWRYAVFMLTKDGAGGVNANLWYAFPANFLDIAAGIFAAKLYRDGFKFGYFWSAVGLLCLFTSYAESGSSSGLFQFPFSSMLVMWVMLASLNDGRFLRFSNLTPVRFMADISYSFFLWHAFVIFIIVGFGWTNMWLVILMALPISLLLAYLSRTFVEKQFL